MFCAQLKSLANTALLSHSTRIIRRIGHTTVRIPLSPSQTRTAVTDIICTVIFTSTTRAI